MNTLVALNGNDPGSTVELSSETAVIRIGRSSECEVALEDDLASRVHACIRFEEGEWRIEDQESLNGTFVNSRQIERAVLRAGDVVRIGDSIFVFTRNVNAQGDGVTPSCFADNTRVRRILGDEKRRIAENPIGADSTLGPVRKLAFLYRLSKELYRAKNIDELVRYTIVAVTDVLAARKAKICLRNSVGRLRTYVSRDAEPTHEMANMLANWVIEKDEALLVDVNENISWSGADDTVERGTALAAPISGRNTPRGAIECFHTDEERSFELADLEFLISVGQLLGLALENLETSERMQLDNDQLRSRLRNAKVKLVGECASIRELRRQISRVATTDVTTLVLGESGTGKEVVSQMLHSMSPRHDGPLIAVNCAAFSESLLESELFGHEKGAFTGADARRIGQFERAHQGTIFLDEVGELSAGCQAKLLRLLEGKPFERLGGSTPIEVNVRLIAATHRDLEAMVQAGDFREDLWYRLRVVELTVPPLRERGEDILSLAEHFVEALTKQSGLKAASFSKESIDAMLTHKWNGNVRELRNAIERALVLCDGEVIQPEDLGIMRTETTSSVESTLLSLGELERLHVSRVLKSTAGNKTKACEVLGITRAALYKKLQRYEEDQT